MNESFSRLIFLFDIHCIIEEQERWLAMNKFNYYLHEISKSVSFLEHRGQIINECLSLVEQIKSMKITEPSKLQSAECEVNPEEVKEATSIVRKDGSVLTPVANSFKLNLFNE